MLRLICRQPAYFTGCLLRTANRGVPPCLSQTVLLDVALLRLRRPIHNKPSGYLRFAALATKPGEISGLKVPYVNTQVPGTFMVEAPSNRR